MNQTETSHVPCSSCFDGLQTVLVRAAEPQTTARSITQERGHNIFFQVFPNIGNKMACCACGPSAMSCESQKTVNVARVGGLCRIVAKHEPTMLIPF